MRLKGQITPRTNQADQLAKDINRIPRRIDRTAKRVKPGAKKIAWERNAGVRESILLS